MDQIKSQQEHADEPFNNEQAMNEGWFVCEMNDTFHIEHLDEVGTFDTDLDAIIHIAEQAKAGSEYHKNALLICGTRSDNPYGMLPPSPGETRRKNAPR